MSKPPLSGGKGVDGTEAFARSLRRPGDQRGSPSREDNWSNHTDRTTFCHHKRIQMFYRYAYNMLVYMYNITVYMYIFLFIYKSTVTLECLIYILYIL